MSQIIGIDLGTSTTCMAVVKDGVPTVIPGAKKNMVTPSYIHVMENNRILIGESAKDEVIADPYNTIWATKRLIGRRFDDPEVQECRKKLFYKISGSPKGDIILHGRNKTFTPISVASLILKFIANAASKYLEFPVSSAVITVPASFNDLQRKATKMAGEKIGLTVERLVNEPTAAALAWGYKEEHDRTVAVYDLGGGTFDVSILAIGHGVFEVLATRGDSWLGGEDFDNRLVDFAEKEYRQKYGLSFYNDKMAHQRVKTAAEKTKMELSSKDTAHFYVKQLMAEFGPYADVDHQITRSQFESMVEDLVDHTVVTFKNTLDDVELDKDEIDNVILVGGMTRLPLVRQKIEEFLGRPADISINPDEAVALGASIHAAALESEDIKIPAAPETAAPKPKKKKKVAVPAAAKPAADEEPVALPDAPMEDGLGATPAAAFFGDEEIDRAEDLPAKKTVKAPLLIDVLSQSVGISDVAGLFVPLLPRNSKLPAKISKVFTTSIDQQEAIRISVYQGEDRYIKDKVILGEFVLQGIEQARRGLPQIEVTFNIDQSGLFTVGAKDLKTRANKEIVVEGLHF